jgi:hypothetical protein
MSHSDKSSSEGGGVYSRRGGTRIDASGASKATKKTNAEKGEGFVCRHRTAHVMIWKREKEKVLLQPAAGKQNQQKR